jgi:hypothetical protein
MPGSPSASTASERVYHVELRHFPRNLCRFNLGGEELRATVLEPWTADRPFELGELRWDPRQARLTVLKGPRIPPEQLSMGRGWRTAQRQSQDVTAQVLAAAAEAPAEVGARAPGASDASAPAAPGAAAGGGPADRPAGSAPAADLIADSLGLRLLAQMGDRPTPLRRAWELASAHDPGSPASETLAVAERAVTSLLRARLVVLLSADEPESTLEAGPGATPAAEPDATLEAMGEEHTAAALRAPESWIGTQVWMRRA